MNAMLLIRKIVFSVTQSEMAAIAGTTQASVSRWERGELSPDLTQLARIREAAKARRLKWTDKHFFEVAPEPAPSDLRATA